MYNEKNDLTISLIFADYEKSMKATKSKSNKIKLATKIFILLL